MTAAFIATTALVSAQENRTTTTTTRTTTDTIATKAVSPTAAPTTGSQRANAVHRRSATEVNAERASKQNNQTRAQQKPDPYDRPLTEPNTDTNGGNATIRN
jgi:hypothetical protein